MSFDAQTAQNVLTKLKSVIIGMIVAKEIIQMNKTVNSLLVMMDSLDVPTRSAFQLDGDVMAIQTALILLMRVIAVSNQYDINTNISFIKYYLS